MGGSTSKPDEKAPAPSEASSLLTKEGATTMLVVTNLNKFVVIGFGIAFLGESSSWQAIVGCTAALGGGVWYARARSQLAKAAAAAAAADGGAAKVPPA